MSSTFKLSAAYICLLANVNCEANSVDQNKEQSDLGLHCWPRGFKNISADEKSRRLVAIGALRVYVSYRIPLLLLSAMPSRPLDARIHGQGH